MVPSFSNHERCRQLKTINKLSALLGTTPQLAPTDGDIFVQTSKQEGSSRISHPSPEAQIPIHLDVVNENQVGNSSVRRRFKNLSISVASKEACSSVKKSDPSYLHSLEVAHTTPYVKFSNYQEEKLLPVTPIDSPLSPFSLYSFDTFDVSSQMHLQDSVEDLPPVSLCQEDLDDIHIRRRRLKKMAKLRRQLGECPPMELVFSGSASRIGVSEGDIKRPSLSYVHAESNLSSMTPKKVSSPRLSSIVQEIGEERLVVESRTQLMKSLRQL